MFKFLTKVVRDSHHPCACSICMLWYERLDNHLVKEHNIARNNEKFKEHIMEMKASSKKFIEENSSSQEPTSDRETDGTCQKLSAKGCKKKLEGNRKLLDNISIKTSDASLSCISSGSSMNEQAGPNGLIQKRKNINVEQLRNALQTAYDYSSSDEEKVSAWGYSSAIKQQGKGRSETWFWSERKGDSTVWPVQGGICIDSRHRAKLCGQEEVQHHLLSFPLLL